jgi:hypothetical protein
LVNGQQVWTQPGGIGTLVYPQPQELSPERYQGYPRRVMNYPALYSARCGHFFNCYEIFEVLSPSDGHQVALVVCPQCGFIQEIIDPYERFTDYMDTPLVIA